VVLTVQFHETPWIGAGHRVQVEPLARGFWQVTLHFGFMNQPDIPQALTLCAAHGLPIELFATSFFLSRETVVPSTGAAMAPWREKLFAALSRNASGAVEFFNIPHNSVIELGTRVQI
jgi:KUP system potassium uptake protein